MPELNRAKLKQPPRGDRHGQILQAATARFGGHGYEETRWADIARDVGVGPTALYHYFESKQHCLFVIMEQAIYEFRARFDRVVAGHPEYRTALHAVLVDTFTLTGQEILRNRVLVAESGLLSTPRSSPREEQARQAARARIRDLDTVWATFLARGMQQGVIPEVDVRLLARAILGLYNAIWQWYRPGGAVELRDLRDFYVDRCLALAGVGAEVPPTRAAA